MLKLFFFDIDGTLIDCLKGINEPTSKTIKAINELKKQGHLVFIATGRPKIFLSKEILALPFDGFICCNGAIVEFKEEIIKAYPLKKQFINELRDLTLIKKFSLKFEHQNKITYTKKYYQNLIRFFEKYGLSKSLLVEDQQDDDPIYKLSVHFVNEEHKVEYLDLDLSNYEVGYLMPGAYEISAKKHSKYTGIQDIISYLNQEVETYAFGDGDNDLMMISQVDHGIAMGNCSLNLQKCSKEFTTSVSDEGIYNYLKNKQLI